MRGPSSSSASSGRTGARTFERLHLRRNASWLPVRPCAWPLPRADGARLRRACALRRLRARPGPRLRGFGGGGLLPRRSCVLRLRARANPRARWRVRCVRPRSGCAARRRTFGADAGALPCGSFGLGLCGRASAATSGAGAGSGLRLAGRADDAALYLLDHDLLGAAMAEALAHDALLDAALERQRLLRRSAYLVARMSSFRSFGFQSLGLRRNARYRGPAFRFVPVRKRIMRRQRAMKPLAAGPASRAACTTFDRPNAKSNCWR